LQRVALGVANGIDMIDMALVGWRTW
jgi:hypothetical protein